MEKTKLGAAPFIYPQPVLLVGVNVCGKPNYLVVAHVGVVQDDPPLISLSLRKIHYSNSGIRKAGCFSVNTPSAGMVELVDYCGIVSGRSVDKSGLFTSFYGQLGNAPMIAECPLNLECKLIQTIDFQGTNELMIGQVVQAYAEPKYLVDGAPDPTKMNPLVYTPNDNNYWRLGEHAGAAWDTGRQFKPPAD